MPPSSMARFQRVKRLQQIAATNQSTSFLGARKTAVAMDIDDFKEKFPNELVPSPEEFIAATNVIMEARRNIGFDKDG